MKSIFFIMFDLFSRFPNDQIWQSDEQIIDCWLLNVVNILCNEQINVWHWTYSFSKVRTIWIGLLFGPPTHDPRHMNWNKLVTHSEPAWGISCGIRTLWRLVYGSSTNLASLCSHRHKCVGAGWSKRIDGKLNIGKTT